jgi:ubiquinone biosynthesis protein UbiJ
MSLLGTLALTPLELVLARLIAHDPHTAKRIEAFDGKLIEILVELTSTPNAGSVSLCLVFRGQRVKLNLASSAALMQTPDAVLEGSASALLDLLAQPAQKRALSNPALTVSGDADLNPSALPLRV